ncbi:hypothetical protein Tco_0246948 [Tanacetum coccineum]
MKSTPRAKVPSIRQQKDTNPKANKVFKRNHKDRIAKRIIGFSIKRLPLSMKNNDYLNLVLGGKPTGKNFQDSCLGVPTGKIFTSSTTKVDSDPTNGSDEDITNQYECEQTLDVSVGTINLSAGTSFNPKKEGLRVWLLKRLISQKPGLQGILI